MAGLGDTLEDLRQRLDDPHGCSAWGKLTSGIMQGSRKRSPFQLDAREFNLEAERYYREDLRRKHLTEALDFFESDLSRLNEQAQHDSAVRDALAAVLEGADLWEFSARLRRDLLQNELSGNTLRRFIHLMLAQTFVDSRGSTREGAAA
jgi:hypothetical protein